MSSTNAYFYWRRSGMSFLKFANTAAECVRNSIKEPARSQAKLRETVYFKSSPWTAGKPDKTGKTGGRGEDADERRRRRGIDKASNYYSSLPPPSTLYINNHVSTVITDMTEHLKAMTAKKS